MPKISVGESFTVAIISGIEKVWIRGGEYQDFLVKFFVSQCRKVSKGNLFNVSLISRTEKAWIREKGSINIFRRNFFVSQCRKIP